MFVKLKFRECCNHTGHSVGEHLVCCLLSGAFICSDSVTPLPVIRFIRATSAYVLFLLFMLKCGIFNWGNQRDANCHAQPACLQYINGGWEVEIIMECFNYVVMPVMLGHLEFV